MGGSGSSRAVFSRLWEAYGHGRLDDALHLMDPRCTLHVSVSDRVYRGHDGVRAGMLARFSDGRLLEVTSYSSRAEALDVAAEARPGAD